MATKTIEQRVYEALTGSTALMAIATGGVHYAYPAGTIKPPLVSYYKLQAQASHSFNGSRYEKKIIAVDIWSLSSATNNQIADLVTEALGFMLKDIETDVPDDSNDRSGIKHKNIKYFILE